MEHIHILLHLIEGPINLGAIARAMANTGFSKLRFSGGLTGGEDDVRKFALHAYPIIEQSRHCDDLGQMVEHIDQVFGFTPRDPWPDDGRGLDLAGFHQVLGDALERGKSIGLLFGNEARGLQNEHLVHCHHRVALPTNDDYISMNLSQAVMVVLWEVIRYHGTTQPAKDAPPLATPEQKMQLLTNLRQFLETIEFLNPQNPDHLWSEIHPLFNGRDWTDRELTLLHAIFGKARSRYLANLRKVEASKKAALN